MAVFGDEQVRIAWGVGSLAPFRLIKGLGFRIFRVKGLGFRRV